MQGPASPTGTSESWEHPPCHSNSFSAQEGRGSTCAAPNLPTAGALHTRLLLLLQHPSTGAGKLELLLAQPSTRLPATATPPEPWAWDSGTNPQGTGHPGMALVGWTLCLGDAGKAGSLCALVGVRGCSWGARPMAGTGRRPGKSSAAQSCLVQLG